MLKFFNNINILVWSLYTEKVSMQNQNKYSNVLSLSPLRITIIYLVVAVLWIVFSDQFLKNIAPDLEQLSRFQTYKGLFYVAVTGLVLYVLIKIHVSAISRETKDLNFALGSANMASWELNLNTDKIKRSHNHHELYGLKERPEQWDMATFLSCVHPEDREWIPREIQKSVVEKTSFEFEYRVIWPDESVHWLWGKGRPVTNSANEVDHLAGVIIDITDKKSNELKLERQKKRLLRSQKIGKLGDWEFNVDSKDIYWSPMVYEIFDRNPGTGPPSYKELRSEYYKQDIAKHDKYLKRALDEGVPYDIDLKLRTGEENYKFVRIIGVPLAGDSGRIKKLSGIVQDITERKELENRIRESEEKYRHLFENNPEPMWIFDPDTLKFLEVNQAAIDHYGYTQQEFLNMGLADIRPPEDVEAMKKDVKKNTGEKSYSESWTHITKSGTTLDVEISAADVRYGDKTCRLVLVNDVTEQKKLQRKVFKSVIEGEDRERKRIAGELHDGIGQYLSAANMNLESVKKQVRELSDKSKKRFLTGLSFLKTAIKETRNIAHNLMPDVLQEYGLKLVIQTLAEDMEEATDVSIEIEMNISEKEMTPQIMMNMYRIIQEALSNAVKHGKCSEIRIRLTEQMDTLQCIIKDDGIGTKLDKQHAERGMGLRSIETRIDSMAGKIDFESETGKGMTMKIRIPLKDKRKSDG